MVMGLFLPDGPLRRTVAGAAVALQSWIVASIMSRRTWPVRSYLAYGNGDHRIRTVPPVGR